MLRQSTHLNFFLLIFLFTLTLQWQMSQAMLRKRMRRAVYERNNDMEFYQEPSEVYYLTKSHPAILQCKIQNAHHGFFKCNGVNSLNGGFKLDKQQSSSKIIQIGNKQILVIERAITKAHLDEFNKMNKNMAENSVYSCVCQGWLNAADMENNEQENTIVSNRIYVKQSYLESNFEWEPMPTSGILGKSVEIRCLGPDGDPKPLIYWLKNGQPIEKSNKRLLVSHEGSLLINEVRLSDEANYTCVAENLAGRRISEAQLTVSENLGWTNWSNWTECELTQTAVKDHCGEGVQKRFRTCLNPPTVNNAIGCDGFPHQTIACFIPCKAGSNIQQQLKLNIESQEESQPYSSNFDSQEFSFTLFGIRSSTTTTKPTPSTSISLPISSSTSSMISTTRTTQSLDSEDEEAELLKILADQDPNSLFIWSQWNSWSMVCNSDCLRTRRRDCKKAFKKNGKLVPVETGEVVEHNSKCIKRSAKQKSVSVGDIEFTNCTFQCIPNVKEVSTNGKKNKVNFHSNSLPPSDTDLESFSTLKQFAFFLSIAVLIIMAITVMWIMLAKFKKKKIVAKKMPNDDLMDEFEYAIDKNQQQLTTPIYYSVQPDYANNTSDMHQYNNTQLDAYVELCSLLSPNQQQFQPLLMSNNHNLLNNCLMGNAGFNNLIDSNGYLKSNQAIIPQVTAADVVKALVMAAVANNKPSNINNNEVCQLHNQNSHHETSRSSTTTTTTNASSNNTSPTDSLTKNSSTSGKKNQQIKIITQTNTNSLNNSSSSPTSSSSSCNCCQNNNHHQQPLQQQQNQRPSNLFINKNLTKQTFLNSLCDSVSTINPTVSSATASDESNDQFLPPLTQVNNSNQMIMKLINEKKTCVYPAKPLSYPSSSAYLNSALRDALNNQQHLYDIYLFDLYKSGGIVEIAKYSTHMLIPDDNAHLNELYVGLFKANNEKILNLSGSKTVLSSVFLLKTDSSASPISEANKALNTKPIMFSFEHSASNVEANWDTSVYYKSFTTNYFEEINEQKELELYSHVVGNRCYVMTHKDGMYVLVGKPKATSTAATVKQMKYAITLVNNETIKIYLTRNTKASTEVLNEELQKSNGKIIKKPDVFDLSYPMQNKFDTSFLNLEVCINYNSLIINSDSTSRRLKFADIWNSSCEFIEIQIPNIINKKMNASNNGQLNFNLKVNLELEKTNLFSYENINTTTLELHTANCDQHEFYSSVSVTPVFIPLKINNLLDDFVLKCFKMSTLRKNDWRLFANLLNCDRNVKYFTNYENSFELIISLWLMINLSQSLSLNEDENIGNFTK